jgi:2-hydroxychromene-2-carboxylate isomerase
MTRQLSVTFDYRCPFAYNGHTCLVDAVRAGQDLDVHFRPFSLDQVHVEEGGTAVWDRAPEDWGTGVLALLYGIAVRDAFPEHFLDAHVALFETRHVHGNKLFEEENLRAAVASVGLDADAVAEEAWSGRPLKTLADEHTEAVDTWGVFGVPTFIEGDQAVFVRLMERHRPDDLARMLEQVMWTNLNEFKRTRIPR